MSRAAQSKQFAKAAFFSGPPFAFDPRFVERIIHSYKLAAASYLQPAGSMWGVIADRYRQDIHAKLMGGDADEIAKLLGNPSEHDLLYGIDPLSREYVEQARSLRGAAESSPHLLELLVQLSELVCGRRVWNPEPGGERPQNFDADELLSELDRALGVRIQIPNPFPNEHGLVSKRGIISHRVPYAIQQAWQIRQLSRVLSGNRTIEIGGGFGRTAFYARALGVRDYTIVDIPLSLVVQAAFLGATLGADALWMTGDPPERQAGRIRLCPPQWLFASDERFDIALNADSITEMTPDQAIEYCVYLSSHCSALISINHELNEFRACDFPRLAGLDIPVLRHAFPMRPGYTEEIHFFDTEFRPSTQEVPRYEPHDKSILRSRRKTAAHLLKLLTTKSFHR